MRSTTATAVAGQTSPLGATLQASTGAANSITARILYLFFRYTSIGSVSVKAHYQPLEAG